MTTTFEELNKGDWFTYKGDVCVKTERHEVHKSRVVPIMANLDKQSLNDTVEPKIGVTPINVELGEVRFAGESPKAVDIKPGYAVKISDEVLIVFTHRRAVSLKGRMMELSGGPMRFYEAELKTAVSPTEKEDAGDVKSGGGEGGGEGGGGS